MAESRLKDFKNKGRDASSLRRRRQEQSVELRKTKRLEAMSKRRHVDLTEDGPNGGEMPSEGMAVATRQNSAPPKTVDIASQLDLPVEKLEAITECLTCLQAREEVLPAMERVRRLVSTSDFIDAIIKCGLLTEVVSVSVQSDDNKVLAEFSWILTNVTSGTVEQTEEVVNLGCVPVLVGLLSHPSPTVQHQSLWALGNIAGNSAVHRDMIATSGVIQYLGQRLSENLSRGDHVTRKIVFLAPWVISNLCRFNNPSPAVELASVLMPMLLEILNNGRGIFSSTELRDCCWGLSYLTDGFPNEQGIDPLKEIMITQFNVVPLVIAIVQNAQPTNVTILVPCVRFLGNLCSGSDRQTLAVIGAGVLAIMPSLLSNEVDRLIAKEAVWLISNCLSSTGPIVKLIAESGLVTQIMNLMRESPFIVLKECSWAVRNFAMVGCPDVIPYFVELGGVDIIRRMLDYEDTQIVLNGLESLMATLRGAGSLLDKVTMMVEEAGMLDSLELLQCSSNSSVADEAFSITDEFFASEENPKLEALVPTASGSQFQFSAPPTSTAVVL